MKGGRRSLRGWLTIAFVVLFAIGVRTNVFHRFGAASVGGGPLGFGSLGGDNPGRVIPGQGPRPSPSDEEKPSPLGTPSAPGLRGDATSYAFENLQGKGPEPVAYDPCRPIHIVVNSRTAPPWGDRVLREAIGKVSSATGLKFILEGVTTEDPKTNRDSFQPKRYGDRWAPVLVAWTDPDEIDGLGGEVIGLGGSNMVQLTDGAVYVTGLVFLDGPSMIDVGARWNGVQEVEGVIEHELGHVVGLQHVDDPKQLMYHEGNGMLNDYGAGDLAGLAQLGRGACYPDI